MNNKEKIVEILENKVPYVQNVINYKSLDRLVLCNRNNRVSVVCELSFDDFKNFVKINNVTISEYSINKLFNGIKKIAFDVSSLLESTQHRYYISSKYIALKLLWELAAQNSLIVDLDINLFSNHVERKIKKAKEKNTYQKWLTDVELAETQYPVIVVEDILKSKSLADGLHRVQKLLDSGNQTVPCRVIPQEIYSDWSINKKYFALKNSMQDCPSSDWYKIENKILEENLKFSNKVSFDDFGAVGVYFNSDTQHIEQWKFYFFNGINADSSVGIHYKFNHNYEYLGQFVENLKFGEFFYQDNLEILPDLLTNNFQLTSSQRTDVSQSYLGIQL